MYNKVILIGRLTKDPDAKVTTTGLSVASFTLAVNRNFSSQDGKKEADFINCVCFGKVADVVGRYVKKGSLINVDGRIQTRTYDAQDGTKRYVTEVVCENVVFLETRQQQGQAQPSNNNFYQQQPQQQRFNQQPSGPSFGYNNNNSNYAPTEDNYFEDRPEVDISEDDLPF